MTPEQAKERLPLIQAFAEGKTIQIKMNLSTEWRDQPELNFDGVNMEYRIKPKMSWYRVALLRYADTVTANKEYPEYRIEDWNLFDHWLTPRIELEV